MNTLANGVSVCITVTLLDGMVLARSAFHHSMNCRSVMILGTATVILNEVKKADALDVLVDHLIVGRSKTSRPASRQELKATTVLQLQISEASVKSRNSPPKDDKEDIQLDYWAGTIPMNMAYGTPESVSDLKPGIETPNFMHLNQGLSDDAI